MIFKWIKEKWLKKEIEAEIYKCLALPMNRKGKTKIRKLINLELQCLNQLMGSAAYCAHHITNINNFIMDRIQYIIIMRNAYKFVERGYCWMGWKFIRQIKGYKPLCA